MTVSDGVEAYVLELVRRHGSVSADVVIDAALYGTGGFYEVGGSAGGRGGDFLTSVEVGPLFGAVVARALDEWWEGMGRPDPFVVVDAGAGPGTLCRTVLAARPECAKALRYVLVERSATLRARHAERIALEEPALAFAPVDPDTEQSAAGLAEGPICVSLAKMPRLSGSCIVLANELLDNLPFGLAECRGGTWQEVRVTDDRDALAEYLAPLDNEAAGALARVAPDAPDGARVPLQRHARRWLQAAFDVAGPAGRVVVFDYCSRTTAGAGGPPPGRVAAHLPRPRPRRPLARGPRHAGHHLRGRRRPALPRAPAGRGPPRRPTGSTPGTSGSWSRRAGSCGPSARPIPTSRPSPPAAASPRPRRSPTPTG